MMTMHEASAYAIALTTAHLNDDYESAHGLSVELEAEDVPVVIAALCGSIGGLLLAVSKLTGRDVDELTRDALTGVGARIAADTDGN